MRRRGPRCGPHPPGHGRDVPADALRPGRWPARTGMWRPFPVGGVNFYPDATDGVLIVEESTVTGVPEAPVSIELRDNIVTDGRRRRGRRRPTLRSDRLLPPPCVHRPEPAGPSPGRPSSSARSTREPSISASTVWAPTVDRTGRGPAMPTATASSTARPSTSMASRSSSTDTCSCSTSRPSARQRRHWGCGGAARRRSGHPVARAVSLARVVSHGATHEGPGPRRLPFWKQVPVFGVRPVGPVIRYGWPRVRAGQPWRPARDSVGEEVPR